MNFSVPARRQLPLAFVLVLSLFLNTFAQTAAVAAKGSLSAAENELVSKITVETLKDLTAALSAPDMQGRGTMQPGGDKAAAYLADRMARLGLKPLGDKGSYLQKIKFKETTITPESSVKVGEDSLKIREEFYPLPYGSGDKSASGDLVFAGYAISAKAINRNDLEGMDLTGKMVVMLQGPPANINKEDWSRAHASIGIMRLLVTKGAAGFIFIDHGREEHPFAESSDYLTRRQIALADEQGGFPAGLPPFISIGGQGAEKLFAKSGTTMKDAVAKAEKEEFRAFKLNQSAKINIKYKQAGGTGNNVAGIMEGSDPKLKEEAILFSAHYDAYGMENGKIYPGAADNAIGVAEMLSVAEAFSKMPEKPKRSLIFLAVTGEEYGLYGSQYWAKNPTWDIKKVAANLNLDGIGSELYGPVKTVVGFGAEHSTLGTILSDVAGTMEINIIPDPMPEEKVFYRSDHYSFVERGVPALMLLGAPAGDKEIWMKRIKDWEKTDYHQPGDVIKADWSWEGARAVAVVMGVMGHRIAAADKMPEWLSSSRFAKLERGNTKDVPEEP
jgi:hypothetical protein